MFPRVASGATLTTASAMRVEAGVPLTPAHDRCPPPHAGGEASHAMLSVGQRRDSRLSTAPAFLLKPRRGA